MNRKLPNISTSKRVCIVCEGDEEYHYINKLKDLKVFHRNYSVKPANAKGLTNVFKKYDNSVKSGNYNIVLIFCDTDNAPFKEFKDLQNDLKDTHDKNKVEDLPPIIYFGNPCSMQIILSHFDKVKLKSRLKSANAPLIEKLTGIKNYRAQESDINSLMNKINKSNYNTMKNNIANLPTDFNITPSTNILTLFKYLECDKTKWINDINKRL